MWALFTAALTRASSTTRVSVINTSANFMLTAFAGWLVFGENLPGLWWVGAAMLVVGNVIIGRRDEGNTGGGAHGEAGKPGENGQRQERYRDESDSDRDLGLGIGLDGSSAAAEGNRAEEGRAHGYRDRNNVDDLEGAQGQTQTQGRSAAIELREKKGGGRGPRSRERERRTARE